jgi:thioredoxin-dependent peroxiredoxin
MRGDEMSSFRIALALCGFASVASGQTQSGQMAQPPALVGPSVGQVAPDFTATATDSTGRQIPISLSSLKGIVVVLAFYPADRSSGCTAEMNKFRDEYAALFGKGVVVLPVSVDSLDSHASWAKESHLPFALISDPTSALATKYGSQGTGRPYFRRTVFVIGRDGKIAYSDMRFNALAQEGYDSLATTIKRAKAE